jgi:hypothetical protein
MKTPRLPASLRSALQCWYISLAVALVLACAGVTAYVIAIVGLFAALLVLEDFAFGTYYITSGTFLIFFLVLSLYTPYRFIKRCIAIYRITGLVQVHLASRGILAEGWDAAIGGDNSNLLPVSITERQDIPKHDASVARKKARVDEVECSIYSPAQLAWDSTMMMQIFLYKPSKAKEARRLAMEFDPDAVQKGFYILDIEVPRNSLIVLHLEIPELLIEEPLRAIRWRGATCAKQFMIRSPKGLGTRSATGQLRVSIEGVPIGNIGFVLQISDANAIRPAAGLGNVISRYRSAFASYASSDRTEVLKRVQALAAVGINVFQDILSLEPGDEWERELHQAIERADLFLLFWSRAAKDSEWVQKEIRYAIDRKTVDPKALPDIVPIIIEGPPPVPPPAELAHLHFNDHRIYLMDNLRK